MASDAGNLNLTTHREPDDIWHKRTADDRRRTLGRALIGIGSSAILLRALIRRPTLTVASIGAVLAWFAFSEKKQEASRHDRVEEASSDSFPASDAPSWTPTVGTSPRPVSQA